MTTKLTIITKQDVPALSQISGMWADVMRMGLEADNNQSDAEWWLERQKEIAFAFKVLAGLGLAYQRCQRKDGKVSWVSSNSMKRLHRMAGNTIGIDQHGISICKRTWLFNTLFSMT